MNFKSFFFIVFSIVLFSAGCGDAENSPNDEQVSNPVSIGENSFVYHKKVYKIINNELLQIGNLNDTNIRHLKISSSELKDLGTSTLSFTKSGADSKITSVYRGNYLYYKFIVTGLNDLRESYLPGIFTIEFLDAYGFTIYSTTIPSSDLVRDVDNDGKTLEFEYNGKIEITMDAQAAITHYDINSSVRHRD